MSAGEPISRIRAVLVGVDEYENPDIRSLQGCVNDVALVRSLLKEYFAVPNEDIRVVVNRRATKAAILHRLRDMISRGQPGDVLVFYYSGHGSQVRDRNGDELTDGLDEIFAELPPEVLLEAFFDCCFWGADARGLEPEPRPASLRPDVRYLPPPFDIAARAEGDDRLEIHQLRALPAFTEHNVLWGASQEGQPAAEDYMDGRPNGIFTYWGCRFIAEHIEQVASLDYTREQLLEDVRGYLHALGYVQTPELSAPSDLRSATPLLSGAWVEVGGGAYGPGRR